jgi:hypothetical protein
LDAASISFLPLQSLQLAYFPHLSADACVFFGISFAELTDYQCPSLFFQPESFFGRSVLTAA